MRLAPVCVLLAGCLIAGCLFAGCLKPSLETCGDLTCPANTECVIAGGGARCATPDQIESCAGLGDGAACTALTGGGVCRDGVCIVPTCGDGVVDPGEDCDDGNRDPGDGCGSTCRTESCGNGVTDFGEGCDCGDANAAPRPECDGHHNSDTDELSPCRADCTLRRCGDGQLDALEQCDGSVPAGITCESLGYHAASGSTLSCSPLCRFDVTGCTGGICGDGAVNGAETCDGTEFATGVTCASFGFYDTDTTHRRCTSACTFDTALCLHRCNDGVVDPGEFCDPGASTPVRGYCTDYGYSAGPLTCSASCGPAFDQCRAPSVWTNVTIGQNNYIELAAGETDSAWALRATGLEHWTLAGTATFAVMGLPRDLAAFGDLAAVSSYDGKVRLYDPTGLVMTLVPPNPCRQLVMTAADTIVCVDNDSAAWWVNGTWQPAVTTGAGPPSDAIARADGSVLFSDWGGAAGPPTGSMHTIDSAGVATTQAGETTNIEHLDHRSDGYFGGLAYGGGTYGDGPENHNFNLVAQDASGTWFLPNETHTAFSATEAGGVRFYGAVPEQVTIGTGAAKRTGSADATTVRCSRTAALGDGALCMSFGGLWRFAGASVALPQVMPGISPGALADTFIDERDTAYFASSSGFSSRNPGITWAPPAGPLYTTIVGRSSTAILLIGTTSGKRTALAKWSGAAWTTATAANDITAAAVDPTGNLAVAVAGATPTAPCTLYTGPVDALVAGPLIECPTSMWYSPTGVLWYASRGHLVKLGGSSFDISANGTLGTPWITGTDDTHLAAAVGHIIYTGNGTTWTAQLTDTGSAFDWINLSPAGGAIATSGVVTWALHAGLWTKFRLPSDPTPFIHPQLTPWGVYFRTPSGTAAYAAWEAGWP